MDRVRRIMEFDRKGMASLVLWARRRRDGVPPGATEVSYAREQSTIMMIFTCAMAVELIAVEVLLQAMDVELWVRLVVLVLDAYSLLFVLAVIAACVTRPHVVTDRELRIRYGAFFDARVPRELVASARLVRNYNETGLLSVKDGRLGVAVSSQTNVVVQLTEPVTVTRPLGGRAEVTVIRFFADTPGDVVAALRPAESSAA
ncbi:hypothetical protein [Nonomuraea sp. SBT364]|uniref:hypothetical protein n=1 Tax=Nonomuraea sp. SBT364 TaxID=1580530 RepID=UPI00069E7AF9|nr:hypothetical protein [Nonomuraea sp. SBT364]